MDGRYDVEIVGAPADPNVGMGKMVLCRRHIYG